MSKRLSGKGNYLYYGTLEEEVSTAGALSGERFFKITAKASESSGFPPTSLANDVVFNKPAITIVTGDKAKPFSLAKVGFVKDIPNSHQKEKFDETVQIDDGKSYEEGDKPESTGTFDGYFIDDDPVVKEILNRFKKIVEDDGAGSRVYSGIKTGVLHFFLGRSETTTVGEKEIIQYMPVIIDSLTLDKPMEGKQPFTCGYTEVGGERPNMYFRTITA